MSQLRSWRAAFLAYALLIAVLTHWPGMKVEGPIPRPDLIVHAGVFGLWTVLCIRSGLFGRWMTGRTMLVGGFVSIAYAGVDEWTQQLFNRHSTWEDFAANLVGVASGLVALAIWRRTRRVGADNPEPD